MSIDEQEKGLFTFYKEQQAEEDKIRRAMPRKKKGKNTSRKKTELGTPADLLPTSTNIPRSEPQPQQTHSKSFLKNVLGRYGKHHPANESGQQSDRRVNTEVTPPAPDKLDTSAEDQLGLRSEVRRKESNRAEFGRMMFRQKAEHPNKIEKALNFKDLHGRLIHSQNWEGARPVEAPISIIQLKSLNDQIVLPRQNELVSRTKSIKRKKQSPSILDKLKQMELRNNSNLISNRENLLKQRDLLQLEDNQQYFKQLITKFYHQHQAKDIPSFLKLPAIREERASKHLKTEEQKHITTQQVTDNEPRKMVRIKSFSTNKRTIKLKSLEKFQSLYQARMGELADSGQSKLVNYIDMSKEYGKYLEETEERKLKKKMVKSRLGIEL